jgi:hypothetical protein
MADAVLLLDGSRLGFVSDTGALLFIGTGGAAPPELAVDHLQVHDPPVLVRPVLPVDHIRVHDGGLSVPLIAPTSTGFRPPISGDAALGLEPEPPATPAAAVQLRTWERRPGSPRRT